MQISQSVDQVVKRLNSNERDPNISNLPDQHKMSAKLEEIQELSLKNDKIASAMKDKDEQLQQEQLQKKKLEEMLQEMEQKMVKGGEAIEEEKEKFKAKAYREYQKKIKKQKQKEVKLLEEQKK